MFCGELALANPYNEEDQTSADPRAEMPSFHSEARMAVVNCPSCPERTEVDENEVNVEWECPKCSAAFTVEKGRDGSVHVKAVAPPPSSAIQPATGNRKGLRRQRNRRPTDAEGQAEADPHLDISLPAQSPLQSRFPDMQPGNPPPLFTFNGIGIALYGSRDFDQATGTYVASACLVVLFIPIFILGSYRVANAQSSGWFSGSSWHVLGRVPLSPLARGWNWTVAALLGMFVIFLVTRA
jgi:hypothetical protein